MKEFLADHAAARNMIGSSWYDAVNVNRCQS